jgi:hypothetical protein
MFTSVALRFQQMRRNRKKSEEGVSISKETARHGFLDRYLKRLRLILILEHSMSERVKSGLTLLGVRG